METIVGVIDRVVFQAEDSEYKIFILRKRDKSKISVQGELPELFLGTALEVHGEYTQHKKYGMGFRADAYTYTHSDNPRSIVLYLQSIAKWIGPEKAKKIVDKFGTDLDKILESDCGKLTEVEGIGKTSAESLAEAWLENKEMKNIRIFLQSLGLTSYKIKKVISSFGPRSEELLKENPYLLCFHGFGFSTCDSIAKKLGIDADAELRYKFFILQTLRECLGSGHLFLLPSDLVLAFNKYNRLVDFSFNDGDEIDFTMLKPYLRTLRDEGYIYVDGNKFYDMQSYFYESNSASIISKIMNTEPRMAMDKVPVGEFIKKYEKKNKIDFSDEQKDAITSFVSEKVLVVTGSPGTGKTTVLKAFVQLMRANNISFELLTPTGISAKKLGDTAGHPAMTIHRRLGYKGTEWTYGADNKYATDVVLVDETSMVDQEVFYRLVSSLYSHAKLVFVGDYDQLPSVGPGCVLRELVNSEAVKTVFLSRIFRQAEQSDIISAAFKIKEGNTDLSLFKKDKKADIWFVRDNNPGNLEKIIIKFAQELKESERLKSKKQGFQIITPRNTGPLSVETLNIALQGVLNPPSPDKKEVRTNSCIIRKGDRVIIKKNNYDLGVFNGDIGKIISITPGHILLDVDDFSAGGKRRIDMPMKLANEMLKLAYAITVHKSQGLEYPLVILPFVKAHGRNMLQRNLLYTAITRAKKKVIVMGQGSAVQQAIENDKIQRRNTVFGERVKLWISGQGTSLREHYGDASDYQNVKTLKQLLSLEEKTS
jgi:exodeoxyribonuclease V alpha subunit